ncbi:MAG TPA: prepilin-type N-terminal cleavage/methylation domain-containing protein [Gemmatimonadaceae bacterium]|nr:prepilin-type N-terminal cleavage/methylation domain-containing protein [Gemmatimonadaceae bacterium]
MPIDAEPDSMWPRDRSGFTLIELMVALTIGAGLLLAGRLLLEQITATEHIIVADSAAQDTSVTQGLLLHSLVRNLEVGTDSLTTFAGNEHIAQFTTWCIDTTALRIRCRVRLTIDTTLTAVTSATPLTTLQHTTKIGQFRYLSDARNGGQWYRSWGIGLTAPLAIGIIVGHDTTVLRVGDRG